MTVERAYREMMTAAGRLDTLTPRSQHRWSRGHEEDPGLEPWRAYLRAYSRWIRALREERGIRAA